MQPHRDLWQRCLDLGVASLDTPLMCEVIVASLPSTPPPELVDDVGRLHLFFTVHHADEHRPPPWLPPRQRRAWCPISIVLVQYFPQIRLGGNPMQVLLVNGLETGSSSGWFVRGILGAHD